MKRTGLVLGLTALGLLGLALTQGMMGGYGPGYGMMGPGMMGMGMGGMGMMAVYPPKRSPSPRRWPRPGWRPTPSGFTRARALRTSWPSARTTTPKWWTSGARGFLSSSPTATPGWSPRNPGPT